jgi:hypothetical protein
MKALLLCSVGLSCFTAAAQTPMLPSFDENIAGQELSLTESIKKGILPAPGDLASVRDEPTSPQSASKRVSHMPIIVPDEKVYKNMPVIRPDPSTDHKMIVRNPQIESRGERKWDNPNERLAQLREQRKAALERMRLSDAAREEALQKEAQRR